jgi:hypothetical protein
MGRGRPSVCGRNSWLGLGVRRSEHPRGMLLVTRLQELQAEQRRETQWHSSSVNLDGKRAPYSSRNPMALTPTQQNPW